MKIIFVLIAVFGLLGSISCNLKNAVGTGADDSTGTVVAGQSENASPKDKPPVLIELFTSEGCSSCPPADRNLIALETRPNPSGAEVITLALHVDYWNRLGWTDPFSSPQSSERQSFYSHALKVGDIYTPQMIVDGTHQFVGGSLDEAQKAIGKSVKIRKANVELAVSGGNLKVKISELPEHDLTNVFLAIAENDLSTSVKSGENGGKTLPHSSVVRELRTIGSIKPEDSAFETETAFKLPDTVRKENTKLVVFVQIQQSGKIIGVSRIKP